MIPELEQIKRLLWKEWDPIGCGVPEDEYDSYAFRVFVMLNEGKDQNEIADYLRWVETDHMGLDGSGREVDIAPKIVAIHASKP